MGVLGGFGDTIKDVSRNITKAGIKDGFNTYIKQSGDELADAARKTLSSQLNAADMIKKSDVENLINTSSKTIEGNPDYINQTGKLLKSLESKDMERFEEIANNLANSKSYEDSGYLDLLLKANTEVKSKRDRLDTINSEAIKGIYKSKFAEKLPKGLDKYISEGQKDKVTGVAYHLNAKKKYFATDDPKTNQIRVGAAATAYMGTMTGARLLNGGGLTENEYGERDIVGIPFI